MSNSFLLKPSNKSRSKSNTPSRQIPPTDNKKSQPPAMSTSRQSSNTDSWEDTGWDDGQQVSGVYCVVS